MAVAYGSPRPTDARATATEQEVVIQLVLLYGRSAVDDWDRRALDSEHHSAVVLRREHVAPEAIIIGLPSDRHTLHLKRQPQPFPGMQKVGIRARPGRRMTHHVPIVRQVVPPALMRLEIRVACHLGE